MDKVWGSMCKPEEPPQKSLEERVHALEEREAPREKSPKEAILTATIIIVIGKSLNWIFNHLSTIHQWFTTPTR